MSSGEKKEWQRGCSEYQGKCKILLVFQDRTGKIGINIGRLLFLRDNFVLDQVDVAIVVGYIITPQVLITIPIRRFLPLVPTQRRESFRLSLSASVLCQPVALKLTGKQMRSSHSCPFIGCVVEKSLGKWDNSLY